MKLVCRESWVCGQEKWLLEQKELVCELEGFLCEFLREEERQKVCVPGNWFEEVGGWFCVWVR